MEGTGDRLRMIENFEDPIARSAAGSEHVVQPVELLEWAVEQNGKEEKLEKVSVGKVRSTGEDHVPSVTDDGTDPEIGDEGGGGAVEGPAEHGAEGADLEEGSFFLEAKGFPSRNAEGSNEPVPLNVLNEEGVEVSSGAADGFPDFTGPPGVKIATDHEDGDGEEYKNGEQGLLDKEDDGDAEDDENGTNPDFGAIEEGVLHVGNVLDHPGADLTTFASVVKTDGQAQELIVKVLPHVVEDFLLEGVVYIDAQTVKDLAQKVEKHDDADAGGEFPGSSHVFEAIDDLSNLQGDENGRENHEDSKTDGNAEQIWVAKEIAGDPADRALATGEIVWLGGGG